MKIKRLVIENFKSIERIELIEPNPFTVFVGPNGSGKSNIFEALEFFNLSAKAEQSFVDDLFGGKETILPRVRDNSQLYGRAIVCHIEFDSDIMSTYYYLFNKHSPDILNQKGYRVTKELKNLSNQKSFPFSYQLDFGNRDEKSPLSESQRTFFNNFSRLFIGKDNLERTKTTSDVRLSLSAHNLERVLKRILQNDTNSFEAEDLSEWMELFVPGFQRVEVASGQLDNEDRLRIYEEGHALPFGKELISDGTFNILALLTAIYQSKNQFLCIEEPENGLNPRVVQELVPFFRLMCEERGHTIWVNSHSQSLVAQLQADEIVVVDKKEGSTKIQQFKGENFYGMRMDEAWLTNALNGGLPW